MFGSLKIPDFVVLDIFFLCYYRNQVYRSAITVMEYLKQWIDVVMKIWTAESFTDSILATENWRGICIEMAGVILPYTK